MRSVVVFGAVTAVAFAAACGLFPTVDGLTGGAPPASDGGEGGALGDGAGAGDASAADANDGGTPCPAGRGPAMVRIGAFCIDSTEVAMADYATFLADAGSGAANAPSCSGNDVHPNTSGGGLYDPGGHPRLPVNSVDWCDAYAYCAWAGKRLCALSEWRDACSHGGERVFPYGADYDGTAGCNGADAALGTAPLLVDVGSRTACQGGYAGLFDMSGNVWEWVDSCEACDAGRCCRHVGGSYGNSPPNLQCTPPNEGAVLDGQDSHDLSVGFRCCSP